MERSSPGNSRSPVWVGLYRIGGVAPFVAALLYLSQFLILLSGETYPTAPQDWFALFQRSRILGLFFLNALDIVSISLIGLMFAALYVALRQTSPSSMAVGAFLAFLGVAVFISARAAAVTATLSLSERYASAAGEAQRSQLVAAGLAVHAATRATPETLGFLFVAVGGAITSAVTLRRGIFSRAAGYLGLAAGLVTIANHLSKIVAPAVAPKLMPVNGLLWLVWWLLMSSGLLRLARRVATPHP